VFFPVWLESVCRILPFASMLQLPVEVWLGQYDASELPAVFSVQAGWVLVLVLAGRRVMSRAVRRVVVQGG
jgi:ABC-2 type transport system permease protein